MRKIIEGRRLYSAVWIISVLGRKYFGIMSFMFGNSHPKVIGRNGLCLDTISKIKVHFV